MPAIGIICGGFKGSPCRLCGGKGLSVLPLALEYTGFRVSFRAQSECASMWRSGFKPLPRALHCPRTVSRFLSDGVGGSRGPAVPLPQGKRVAELLAAFPFLLALSTESPRVPSLCSAPRPAPFPQGASRGHPLGGPVVSRGPLPQCPIKLL